MADITEAIRRLIFEYVSEGADDVIKQQEAVAATTTKTDKASLSLEKAFGGLERRYVETVRHQQDYAKVQEKVNAAVAQNPALQERANTLLAAAGEHFDKLAVNASKGGIAASFLSKAITTVLGPAGLMGAAMTAVGVAVGYVAAQFTSSSTTIEQALAEQNRLMKEGQSLQTHRFQLIQNETDLQQKLSAVMQQVASAAERRAAVPTQVGGEMGEAPTGLGALPGYEKIISAVQTLQTAIAAGQPGLQQFNTTISEIGTANPQVKETVQELLKLGQVGVQLEQAAAVAGRLSQVMLDLAKVYPGMSFEVAKQLYGLEQQLTVAQARTGAERIVAQEIATQNNLLVQGKSLEEATAIAAKQREIAETNVKKAVEGQIKGLQDQLELIEARRNGTEDLVKQEQLYRKVLEDTGDEQLAQLAKVAQRRIDDAKDREQEERAAASRAQQVHRANEQAVQSYNQDLAQAQQKVAEIENHWANIPGIMVQILKYTDELVVSTSNLPQFKTWTNAAGQAVQFNPEGYQSTTTFGSQMATQIEAQKKLYEELDIAYEIKTETHGGIPVTTIIPDFTEALNKLTDANKDLTASTDSLNTTMQDALSPYYSMDPRTSKLGFRAGIVGNPDWLAPGASNENSLAAILGEGATAPGMADGGSFVVGGGYSANDNRIAAFPVASGEEIVVNRARRQQGQGGNTINIDNRTIIQGSVDVDTMAKLKVTQYQQSQRMRGALARA